MELQDLRKPSKVAFGALAVLLIGAIVFYKERLLFADSAFIAFNTINYKSLSIIEHRYGSFITQLVPYLGQKLHLPLKVLLIGYTLSFNVFYLAVISLLIFRFRQYFLAILMGLYYFLFISDTYFWTNNEVHQAVGWMFLFYGSFLYMGNKKTNLAITIPAFIVLAFLTITTHYVVIIPTVFLWLYLLIEQKHWPFSRKSSILFTILLAGVIYLKFAITEPNNYDSNHLHNIIHSSIADFLASLSAPAIGMFLSRCLSNYWAGVLVFIVGLISLLMDKKYILAIWSLIAAFGYFIAIGTTYQFEPANLALFHIESEWACIGIIAATPFVFSFLPKLRPSVAGALLVLIFIIRLFYMGSAIDEFSWRVKFEDRVLANMKKKNIQKLLLVNDESMRSKMILYWALPYESIFLSAFHNENPQRTFIFVDDKNPEVIEQAKNTKNVILDPGLDIAPKDMNYKYFYVDTTQPYQVMTYEALLN